MKTAGINSELYGLLILFDRYVLKEKNGKFQFSGEIFEGGGVMGIQIINGGFLTTIPKYMWNLKEQDSKIQGK